MPRKKRYQEPGRYHIINRGVERRLIYLEPEDYEFFLYLLLKLTKEYEIIVHAFCLMTNHYHLLLETKQNNLSKAIQFINDKYAKYFNKKYKRSGHLWQDRYKSKYITSEEYLYTLIRYIEYNPIEANITQTVGEYPFTFASLIFNSQEYYPCSNDSLLTQQFDIQTLHEYLDSRLSNNELEFLKEKEKQKVVKSAVGIVLKRSKEFEEHFIDVQTKEDRNFAILNAYLDGYTQVDMASYLKLSKSLISKVVKSGDSLTGV